MSCQVICPVFAAKESEFWLSIYAQQSRIRWDADVPLVDPLAYMADMRRRGRGTVFVGDLDALGTLLGFRGGRGRGEERSQQKIRTCGIAEDVDAVVLRHNLSSDRRTTSGPVAIP